MKLPQRKGKVFLPRASRSCQRLKEKLKASKREETVPSTSLQNGLCYTYICQNCHMDFKSGWYTCTWPYPHLHLHTISDNWKVYILVIFNFITVKPTLRFEKGSPVLKSFQLPLKYLFQCMMQSGSSSSPFLFNQPLLLAVCQISPYNLCFMSGL